METYFRKNTEVTINKSGKKGVENLCILVLLK